MSLKIDATSIHLGGDVPQYYAEYVPTIPEEQPPSCLLPPSVPLNLTNKPLVPLIPACNITFPDPVPLPPTYNPPPLKYLACEHLSAKANLKTSKAASKSSLKLTAKGPTSEASGAPGDCSLTLDGDFNVEACESFDAKLDIKFGTALKGSALTLAKTGIPNCGFVIGGTIDLNLPELKACKDFTGKSNVRLGKKFTGGLTLTSTGAPDCGLTLEGDIDLPDYCTDFTAGADISIHGNAVKSNKWKLKSSAPNSQTGSSICGFGLTGDVEINACTNIEASGGVKISGSAVKVVTASEFKSGQKSPDGISCGLFLGGEWEINACQDIAATSDVIFKIVPPPRGEVYGGDVQEEGASGASGPSGSSGSSGSSGPSGASGYGCVSGVGNWITATNTGPSGATGPSGSSGSSGATGPFGKPLWNADKVPYSVGVVVESGGSIYTCVAFADGTNGETQDGPPSKYWKISTGASGGGGGGGSSYGFLSLVPTASGCGVSLSGQIGIQACDSLYVKNKILNVTSACIKDPLKQIIKKNTIKLKTYSDDTHACGLTLTGELQFDGCSKFLITTEPPASGASGASGSSPSTSPKLVFKLKDNILQTVKLPTITTKVSPTKKDGPCSLNLYTDYDPKSYGASGDVVIDFGALLPKIAGKGLTINSGGQLEVKGGGGGGDDGSCVVTGDFKYIYTKYIYRQPETPEGCCEKSCSSPSIDMCTGTLYNFTELHTQLIKNNSTCCKDYGNAHYIDMCRGEINFASLLSPSYFNLNYENGLDYYSSKGQATTINSDGLTVSDHSTNGCGTAFLIGGKLELDSSAKGYYCAIDTCRGELQFGSKEVSGARLTYDMDTETLQLKGDYGIQLDSTNSTITLEGSTSDANSYIDGSNALLYLNPGDTSYISVDAKNQQITMTSANDDALSITPTSITIENSKGGSVDISPVEDKKAYFQEVTLCVDGKMMTAYVLMTSPEAIAEPEAAV